MTTQRQTIADTLKQASMALGQIAESEARLEAELLLAEVLKKTRSHLFAWPEQELAPDQLSRLDTLIEQRRSGKPLAYIIGRREFWSLELEVTPETLIPRPETETLVERALELIPTDMDFDLADLGTGSGAIAAAIASERPLSEVIACDSSATALTVAERNFKRLNLTNTRSAEGSWCQALPEGEQFHLILSNPPYVAEGDPHLELNGLPWEPQRALTAGSDGLSDIRQIINQAPAHLLAGGRLLLEHGPDQGAAVRQLMADGGFLGIITHRDLGGRERVTEGMKPPT
ncbi:MAG: peptide chain release factor N(5)-glutamine methyltransferase [Candidatus Sedimenticola sp. (ex Thyasira tokunagai)]